MFDRRTVFDLSIAQLSQRYLQRLLTLSVILLLPILGVALTTQQWYKALLFIGASVATYLTYKLLKLTPGLIEKSGLLLRERTLAFVLTGVLVLFVYFLLNQIGIPDIQHFQEQFMSIDFLRFSPETTLYPGSAKSDVVTNEESDTSASKNSDSFQLFEILPSEIQSQTTTRTEAESSRSLIFEWSRDSSMIHGLERIKPQAGQAEVAVGEDSSFVSAFKSEASRIGKHEPDDTLRTIGIGRKSLTNRQLSRAILKNLANWIKQNQTYLSPIIMEVLNAEPDDLTTRVRIKIDEKIYTLFISYNEASQEVAILLLFEDKDSHVFLLRDAVLTGKQHVATGFAKRDKHGNIVSISIQNKKPTLQEIENFNSLFLSWWESISY